MAKALPSNKDWLSSPMQSAYQSFHPSIVQLHERRVYPSLLLMRKGSHDDWETQCAASNVVIQDTASALMQHETGMELGGRGICPRGPGARTKESGSGWTHGLKHEAPAQHGRLLCGDPYVCSTGLRRQFSKYFLTKKPNMTLL